MTWQRLKALESVAQDGRSQPFSSSELSCHPTTRTADAVVTSADCACRQEGLANSERYESFSLPDKNLAPSSGSLPRGPFESSTPLSGEHMKEASPDEPWIVSHMMAGSGQLLGISPGCRIEVAMHDEAKNRSGTALFIIQQLISMDSQGIALEADYLGASNPLTDQKLAKLWKKECLSPGALHLCHCKASACCFDIPGRTLIHFDTARRRHVGPNSASWMKTPIIAPVPLPARGVHMSSSAEESGKTTMPAYKVVQLRDKLERAKRRFQQSQEPIPAGQEDIPSFGPTNQVNDGAAASPTVMQDFREGPGLERDAQLAEIAAASLSQFCAHGTHLGSNPVGALLTDGSGPIDLQSLLSTTYKWVTQLAQGVEKGQVSPTEAHSLGHYLGSLLIEGGVDGKVVTSIISKSSFRLPVGLLPPCWKEMPKGTRKRWA